MGCSLRFSLASGMIALLVLVAMVAGCGSDYGEGTPDPDATTSISGTVRCNEARLPLAGVAVTLSGGTEPAATQQTLSGADGTYQLSQVSGPWGLGTLNFTLRATAAGYQDYEAVVSVSERDHLTHNIFMVPLS